MTDNDKFSAPINESKIVAICESLECDVDVVVLPSVGSTNTYLLEQSTSAPVTLCAAEHQTVGRGRRGKEWHSPNNGVTFSLRFERSEPVSEFAGLSLLVGAALCDQLRVFGAADAMLKWPNDVLVNDAKLAGILIETTIKKSATTVVVGIGINYRRGKEAQLIDQSSTDLFEVCGATLPDRSEVIACVATRVIDRVSNNIPDALHELATHWSAYNALKGRNLTVESAGKRLHGRCAGIDASGGLLLKTETGIVALNSAEISVRGV